MNACPTDISPQTTLHLLVWFVHCVHVCVSVLGSNHQFQQHPYLHHIYQPEQPFLLRGKQSEGGWVGWQLLRYRKNTTYQTSEPFQLISTGRQPNVLLFGPTKSTHLCCRTCYGNISAPPLPLSYFSHTNTRTK